MPMPTLRRRAPEPADETLEPSVVLGLAAIAVAAVLVNVIAIAVAALTAVTFDGIWPGFWGGLIAAVLASAVAVWALHPGREQPVKRAARAGGWRR